MKYSNYYINKISKLRNLSYNKTREILDSVEQVTEKFMPILEAEMLLEYKFTDPIQQKCALAEYYKRIGHLEMAKWFLNQQNVDDSVLFSSYKEKDKINVH